MPLHHAFSFNTFSAQKKPLLVLVLFVVLVCYIIQHTQGLRSLITSHGQNLGPTYEWYNPATGSDSSSPLNAKYAYATLLTNTTNSTQDAHYIEALRLLLWQLKIAPETKSPANLPVVVLCTDNVAEIHRENLKVWGADLVVVVEREYLPWQKVGQSRWQDVLTKVRFHDFTQFDKLLFMDADTILIKPIDDVFLEPEAEEQVTQNNGARIRPADAALPASYVFAAVHDNEEFHHWPPVSYANGDFWFSDDYLNAGFYIIKPDPVMLNYYRSLMITPGRFPPSMPEQGLFNYAHQQSGSMPWKVLNYTWNTRVPMVKDLEGGCLSFHEKWWAPFDPKMAPWIDDIHNRMLQYYGELPPTDTATIG